MHVLCYSERLRTVKHGLPVSMANPGFRDASFVLCVSVFVLFSKFSCLECEFSAAYV